MPSITGTMLAPGVSRNKRLYTREQIAKTAARMQARIADTDGLPISMRTHHDAGDDSLRIVGRVTSVQVDPATGEAAYRAVLNTATQAGHDLWSLVKDRKNPLLDSTSIFGWWLGDVRHVDHEGEQVEVGEDLEVDAIDFTGSPGVLAARIRTVSSNEQRGQESAVQGRHIVTETITAHAITEDTPPPGLDGDSREHVLDDDGALCVTCATAGASEAKDPKKPYGDVTYADPGLQKDGKARYPLDTIAHVRAALAYIAKAKNAGKYTSQQLASIKSKINAAAKKFGIKTAAASSSFTGSGALGETTTGAVTEWAAAGCCGFSISAFNGPLTVSVSAYDGIDAADMPAIAQAAMAAALQAIKALDPDEDGDIDAPGGNGTSEDLAGGDLTAVGPDDTEARTYNVTTTATEGVPLSFTITSGATPDPRKVAAAVARRNATTETTPAPAAAHDPPAAEPADVTPATDDAAPAPDSTTEETTMPDQPAAPETTPAPAAPAISTDALTAFAAALGPVIGAAVETAIAKALPGKPAAETTPAAEAKPATETAAPAGADVSALAEAVKASLDGLPGALAEAIKPLITAQAPAAPAAAETAGTPAPAEGTAPAAAPAAETVDPKHVALEAARLAIPELLEAFGLPRRKGLVMSSEHRGSGEKPQTPEDLWANRSQMWDQLIPQAPAAVQQTPAALAAAASAAAASPAA